MKKVIKIFFSIICFYSLPAEYCDSKLLCTVIGLIMIQK